MKSKGIVINLTDNTEAFKAASVEAIARALEMCGMQAENYAALICPVDTGRLRNSLTHVVGGNRISKKYYTDKGEYGGSYSGTMGTKRDLTVYVGTNVEYARDVELGTQRQRAQPYLKPAFLNHISEYERILKNELSKG